jgi:putative methionine-R-sulfoxide reductase with GAF domain
MRSRTLPLRKKGEIVVPIFVRNTLAADIENYFTGVFTPGEQSFVEACASVVGKYLGKK